MHLPRASLAWFFFLGAVLATYLALYWRCLPYPMVFDDFVHVLQNRAIRYIWHPRVFFESEHSRSRPLPYITFALSYAFHGLSFSWLRAWSVVLHLGSAFLVGVLYFRWHRARRSALLAGTIFLLHPLAVDSVIYFSARGTILVLFFLLLALFAHGIKKQGFLSWTSFLLASLAACLSRETAVVLFPLLILLHRLEGRTARSLVFYLFPLWMGGLVLLWMKIGYLNSAFRGFFTVQGDIDISGPFDYLRLSLSLWPRILGLFLSPGSQSIDHQIFLPDSWLHPTVMGGILLWIGFTYAIGKAWLTRSFAWLAPAWFFLSLLPTNSFFPLLDPFAERHFYLALPAFAWAVAWLLPRRTIFPVLLLTLAFAHTFTLSRIHAWKSSTSLWLDAHSKAPSKFRVAYNTAASLEAAQDDGANALELLSSTFRLLKPGDLTFEEQQDGVRMAAEFLRSLADSRGVGIETLTAYLPTGFWGELILLKATIEKDSLNWQRAWQESLARLESAQLSPRAREPKLVQNTFLLLKAEHLALKGKRSQAIEIFERVILPFTERHFPYWTAREALAKLYAAEGREQEAIDQLVLAAYQYKVFKRYPEQLHRKLWELYLKQGDLPRATDAIGELVRVFTDSVSIRRLYADLLLAKKDRHAARQSSEADFYAENAVSPNDEREMLKP